LGHLELEVSKGYSHGDAQQKSMSISETLRENLNFINILKLSAFE
jgi:hypothetical protein